MALTRKFLSALGIEADKIDEIITAHSETVDALKAQRDELKEKADLFDTTKKELEKLKNKESSDSKFEVKYNALKEEYETFKQQTQEAKERAKVESAYKSLLLESGISDKRIASILRVSDLKDVKVDSEGKLVDADKLKKNIETEWSDFIASKGTQGANIATPPNNAGSNKSKADILKIKDTAERQKAIAENHELFGF